MKDPLHKYTQQTYCILHRNEESTHTEVFYETEFIERNVIKSPKNQTCITFESNQNNADYPAIVEKQCMMDEKGNNIGKGRVGGKHYTIQPKLVSP